MPSRVLAIACCSLWLAGCTSVGRNSAASRSARLDVLLNSANFDVLSTHNVGRAYQEWALFMFVGGDDEPLAKAWTEMKQSSGVEGRAGAWVNVVIDETQEWLVWPFFWRNVWTVTADAIEFRDESRDGAAPAVEAGS